MSLQVIFNTRFCIFLLSLYAVAYPFSVYAEDRLNVVVHINDGFKINELAAAVENLRQEYKQADIRVVVIGNAVTRLLKSNEKAQSIVESIHQDQASIGLCHNAINAHKVDLNMLVDGVEIVKEGGNLKIIRLREKGYFYIKL